MECCKYSMTGISFESGALLLAPHGHILFPAYVIAQNVPHGACVHLHFLDILMAAMRNELSLRCKALISNRITQGHHNSYFKQNHTGTSQISNKFLSRHIHRAPLFVSTVQQSGSHSVYVAFIHLRSKWRTLWVQHFAQQNMTGNQTLQE